MLPVEERFMIKEQYKNGMSISEIARQTGNDRKTIRSIIQGPVVTQAKPRQKKGSKLDGFHDYLDKRIQEGVLNGAKLYQELLEQGYRGKARSVRRYVQPHRSARQQQATVRFETAPGQQGQVDWGSFGLIEHQGRQRRLYGFVMTLGWSRAMYLEFTVCADIAWWLRCHLHAFHYFGEFHKKSCMIISKPLCSDEMAMAQFTGTLAISTLLTITASVPMPAAPIVPRPKAR